MTPLDIMVKAAKPHIIPAEEQDMRIQDANWKMLEAAMRAALLALAEAKLPSEAFFKIGMAMGEQLKAYPRSRPGDMFAAQWKAALIAIAEGKEPE